MRGKLGGIGDLQVGIDRTQPVRIDLDADIGLAGRIGDQRVDRANYPG